MLSIVQKLLPSCLTTQSPSRRLKAVAKHRPFAYVKVDITDQRKTYEGVSSAEAHSAFNRFLDFLSAQGLKWMIAIPGLFFSCGIFYFLDQKKKGDV